MGLETATTDLIQTLSFCGWSTLLEDRRVPALVFMVVFSTTFL